MAVLALIIAAVSGIAMAIQGSLNTALSKTIGLLAGTLVVHIIGTGFALILLLGGIEKAHWQEAFSVPWYNYLGGLIGVGIVYGVIASISKVGVAAATTAIIVGQVSMAVLVDHFGWFSLETVPFTIWKGIGIVLITISVWLLLHK